MATIKLTDAVVKSLPAPAHGNNTLQSKLAGFGVRVTGDGVKTYIFNYRTSGGRERRTQSAGPWTILARRSEIHRPPVRAPAS